MLPNSYLEILGNKEPETTVRKDTSDEEDEVAQLILDKQRTLAKAMKAAQDRDADEASYLFRMHSKMIITQPTSKDKQSVAVETSKTQIEKDIPLGKGDDEQPFVENGITFMPGKASIKRFMKSLL